MNITKLVLVPQPQKLFTGAGQYRLPGRCVIGITDNALFSTANLLHRSIKRTTAVNMCAPRLEDTISIVLAKRPRAQGYSLRIDSRGIRLEAGSVAAAFWGAQTLLQILEQCPGGCLPAMRVEDWPDFPDRGVCLDVSRGRIPKLERLMELADNLAKYKINQLQLYTKHTFAFRGHPVIGQGASPLTADDILKLDAYCRERHIELVPYFPSFGHLETVLMHPQYHHLAEDWGKGKYVTPDPKIRQQLEDWRKSVKIVSGGLLSPANPETYRFLDSLFSEYLPLFSSKRFNAGCDETLELGYGQSYKLCQKIGRGRMYLNHIIKLNELSRKYGKQMMFWGDIIRHYPELIPEIPKDVVVLDWGYESNHNFESIRDFKKAGLAFYACPSTASYGSLFPRLPKATVNIAGFAAAACKYGAQGLLNTEWGDGGHYNFMEYSWHGFLFGAEQGWNTRADRKSFTSRFTRLFFKSDAPSLAGAIDRLGEISYTKVLFSQCIWKDIYFASSGKPVFPAEARLSAGIGRDTLKELTGIRAVFQQCASRRREDPLRVLPYCIFAVDTMRHAARKLAVYGPGGKITARAQSDLIREFAALKTRFRELWMARNHLSEIRIVLGAYRRARRAVISFEQPKAVTDFVSKILISRPLPGAGNLQSLDYPADKKSLGFKVREFPGAFCDLHNDLFACGKRDLVVFFACSLEISESMDLGACIGYDGPVKLWMDGKMIFHDPAGDNPANPDKASAPFKVNPGKHEVLVALSSNHGKAWGLFLRFLRHDVLPRQILQGPGAYCLPRISCR